MRQHRDPVVKVLIRVTAITAAASNFLPDEEDSNFSLTAGAQQPPDELVSIPLRSFFAQRVVRTMTVLCLIHSPSTLIERLFRLIMGV